MDLPLLRKDFIIDEYQIHEARAFGADAILLIAACLERGQMQDYLGIAAGLGLDVLVESHTYKELDKSLLAGAMLVGINNRNLMTFEVTLQTTLDLLKDIPDDRVVVSESGIRTRDDVVMLQKAGVDAILVGESLMREKDIGKKVKELLGKALNSNSEILNTIECRNSKHWLCEFCDYLEFTISDFVLEVKL